MSLTARGQVLSVADGLATVEFAAPSGCGACRAQSVCGTGHGRLLHLPVAPGMRAGEVFELAMPEAEFNAGVFVGYLLPALATVFGAVLFSAFGDVAAALGAAGGLLLGLRFARAWAARWRTATLGPGGTVGSPCLTPTRPGDSP